MSCRYVCYIQHVTHGVYCTICVQFYEALSGTSPSEAIDLVIKTCQQTVTYGGLFFTVQEIEVSFTFGSYS